VSGRGSLWSSRTSCSLGESAALEKRPAADLPYPRREMLSDEFDHRLLEDREEVDLLIVIGTSLRVSLSRLPTPAR